MSSKLDNLKKLEEFNEKFAKLKEEITKKNSELLNKFKYLTALLSILPEGLEQNVFKFQIDMIVKQMKDNEGFNIPASLMRYKNDSTIKLTDAHVNDLIATINTLERQIELTFKIINSINTFIAELEIILVAPNDLNCMFYDARVVQNLIDQLDKMKLSDEWKAKLKRDMINALNQIECRNQDHARLISKYPINKLSLRTRKSINEGVILTNVIVGQYREHIERLKAIEKAEEIIKGIKDSKILP